MKYAHLDHKTKYALIIRIASRAYRKRDGGQKRKFGKIMHDNSPLIFGLAMTLKPDNHQRAVLQTILPYSIYEPLEARWDTLR